jgi:hypothetical protein
LFTQGFFSVFVFTSIIAIKAATFCLGIADKRRDNAGLDVVVSIRVDIGDFVSQGFIGRDDESTVVSLEFWVVFDEVF